MDRFPAFFDRQLSCLEIGCGEGATALQLADRFSQLVAAEYYDGHQAAFERFRDKMGVQNCRFVVHNIEERPFEPQHDRLISLEVIEHLNSEDSVQNYLHSLKPGGLAVISVPNKWWIFEQHGARLPLLPWNRVPFFSWLPRPLHERWALARIYTRKRIIRLLEKSGFEVLDSCYITAPMDVLPEGWLKRVVTKLFFKNDATSNPFLSTSILVFAQRPINR